MNQVHIKARREKSIRQRHPWVFSGAVESVTGRPEPGEIVSVVDSRGDFLAQGYYNPNSKICVRLLDWNPSTQIDDVWWRGHLRAALDRRDGMMDEDNTALRLVNAEADLLPGLAIDRYDDVLVTQFTTAGAERFRDATIAELTEALGPLSIYDRSDADTRKQEGLKGQAGLVAGDEISGPVTIREMGATFRVDVVSGQKTGYYLDQRDNRMEVAAYCHEADVLDAFCYTGGFSVHAARAGAAKIALVDSSRAAVGAAEEHLGENGFDGAVESVVDDVFDELRRRAERGIKHDVVVVDPPKMARSQHQVDKALRAYKDVNLHAMRVARPGGILATFSCSAAVSIEAFTLAVSWAAIDANRSVQILRRMGHCADHPTLTSFPESEYLKGLLCRVL